MTEAEQGLVTAQIDHVVACAKYVAMCKVSKASTEEREAADTELFGAIDRLRETIERVAK
ncbi:MULTISPECIES: hypothetical protein [unclassified Luteococcus]|uniref:hypothetical protein n=1 Tax=unclassified Luteococcus TaxID=2639923 RepID=UPI00313DB7E1